MGRTLLELFKNKKLASGKTAAEEYDIKNSKDTPIIPYASELNLPFKLATKIRQGLSQRTRETRFEEETTGLRIIRTLSSPLLYATELIRVTRQSTNAVDDMKSATGTAGDSGILGNLINKAKSSVSKLGAKLGVVPPTILIPTRISLNDKFKAGKEPDTMTTLAQIREDAKGTIVGKFLAKNAKGTPKQIGNQILGGLIGAAKKEVRKKLFGARKDGQQNFAKKSDLEVQYDSLAPYSSTIDFTNEDLGSRNDLSSQYIAYKEVYPELFAQTANIHTGKNQLGKSKEEINPKPGLTPSGKVNVPKPDPVDLAKARKSGQQEVGLKIKNAKDNPVLKYDPDLPQTSYSNTIDETADDPILRNDLSSKLIKLTGTTSENENLPAGSKTSTTINSKNNFKKQANSVLKEIFPKTAGDLFEKLKSSSGLPKNGVPSKIPTLKKPNPANLLDARKLGQVKLAQKEQANAPKADIDPLLKNDPNVPSTAYSNVIDESSTDVKTRNDLSSILVATQEAAGVSKPDPKNAIGIRNKGIPINQQIKKYTELVGQTGELSKELQKNQTERFAQTKGAQQLNKTGVGNSGIPTKKEKVYGNEDPNANKSFSSKLGIETGKGDFLAKKKPEEEKDAKNKDLANYDFMYVKFIHFAGGVVGFRGTITGFQETFTPSWDTNKFIGSPYNNYTYTNIERSVSFNLRVYSTNPVEHDSMWDKLEELAKMVYPKINRSAGSSVTPPLLYFSMGNPDIGGSIYQNKECFIENLTYSVDDTFPWEIGGFSPGYQAPQIVDIQLGIKFVQGPANTASLYSFVPGKNKYNNPADEKKNKIKSKQKSSQNNKDAKSGLTRQRNNNGKKVNTTSLPK
jgi:hypothetical protein